MSTNFIAQLKVPKIKSILLSMVCLLALGGCFNKKPETITLLVATDNKPYSFKDSPDDPLVGFEVDVMKHVAQKLGKTLEIKTSDFASIFADIEGENADCAIAGISPTQERRKIYDFSTSYASTHLVLVSKKGKEINSTEDLFSKSLAVQSGSTCEEVAKKLASQIFGIIVKPLHNNEILIEELITEGSDAVITDSLTAEHFCNENSDLVIVCKISEEMYSPDFETMAIMLPKGSAMTEKINSALSEMQKDGSLLTLEQLWLKSPNKSIEHIEHEETPQEKEKLGSN